MRVQLPGPPGFADGSHRPCPARYLLPLFFIAMPSANAPSDASSTAALRRALRTIPDFPEPGIQFQDITPLLADPALLSRTVDALAAPFREAGVTQVVGIEARGFILAPLVAERLGAGFVPMRKSGKLPYSTRTATYDLEYGTDTIEMHADALDGADRVLIHDDVMATGGTAAAAARLVTQTDATLAGFSFLIALTDLNGRSQLPADASVHTVLPVAG